MFCKKNKTWNQWKHVLWWAMWLTFWFQTITWEEIKMKAQMCSVYQCAPSSWYNMKNKHVFLKNQPVMLRIIIDDILYLRKRNNDEIGAIEPFVLHQISDKCNSLYCLSQTHFISQNPIQIVVIEWNHPFQSLKLKWRIIFSVI